MHEARNPPNTQEQTHGRASFWTISTRSCTHFPLHHRETHLVKYSRTRLPTSQKDSQGANLKCLHILCDLHLIELIESECNCYNPTAPILTSYQPVQPERAQKSRRFPTSEPALNSHLALPLGVSLYSRESKKESSFSTAFLRAAAPLPVGFSFRSHAQ